MMRYHVCKHCFGIIAQWKNWGWFHLDDDWFVKCGKLAEPDYPPDIPRPNPSQRFAGSIWFLVDVVVLIPIRV